jgi:hypothetical protein
MVQGRVLVMIPRRIASWSLVALGIAVCACGSSGSAASASRHPNPDPMIASREPSEASPAAVVCARGVPYDASRGCPGRQNAGGVPVRISYRHSMTGFRPIGAAFAIDGQLVLDTNDPALLGRDEIVVSTLTVDPGEHEVGVTLVLAGTGQGVFAYLQKYRFQARGTLAFSAPRGRDSQLTVVGYEQGGPDTPLEKRPAVRLDAR